MLSFTEDMTDDEAWFEHLEHEHCSHQDKKQDEQILVKTDFFCF